MAIEKGEAQEYSAEEFANLDTVRGTGAEVDWDGFMAEVEGVIGTIEVFQEAFEANGGKSIANLRGKLDRLVKAGTASKAYDGRRAVYKL